jgi:hypothetical protein
LGVRKESFFGFGFDARVGLVLVSTRGSADGVIVFKIGNDARE